MNLPSRRSTASGFHARVLFNVCDLWTKSFRQDLNPRFPPKTTRIFYDLHPGKLTCPLKRNYFNRKYIFQPLIFRGYVRFQGGTGPLYWKKLFFVNIFSTWVQDRWLFSPLPLVLVKIIAPYPTPPNLGVARLAIDPFTKRFISF